MIATPLLSSEVIPPVVAPDVADLIGQNIAPVVPVIAPVVPVVAPVVPVVAPVVPVVAPVVPVVAPITQDTPTGFDITLNADSPLTDADLDDIVAIAENKKLTKEQTETLVRNKEAIYRRGENALIERGNAFIKKQRDAYLADPLFSTPEAMEKTNNTIDQIVLKYGSEELKATLRGPLGNDLGLAKFLHKMGESLQQDTFRGKGSAPSTKIFDAAEQNARDMYPELFETM